jgi:hypothetical protein
MKREQPLPTIVDAIKDVWPIVGNDVLTGEGSENPVLTGKEVGDIVADHVDTYIDKRLLKEWQAATYEQRHVWLDAAFPHEERYGF